MDATISAVIINTKSPFLFRPEIWGSLIASLVALLVAGGIGRYIKPLLGFKPNLTIVDIRRFRQNHHVWRLVIKNTGKEVAKDVQVDVIDIFDDGQKRENFLPMPLRWTHIDTESREILPGQTVYLDVFEHHVAQSTISVNLATRFGGGVNDFREIKPDKSRVKIHLFERSGISFEEKLEVDWNGLFFDSRIKGKKWKYDFFKNKQ